MTEACNLNCTYCYQGHKTTNKMTFDTAKKFVDMVIDNRLDEKSIWYQEKVEALLFDFIGGEPLLEIKLIRQIIDYIESRLIVLEDCPWTMHHMYSMSSNGTLYFDPEVQDLIQEYREFLSIGITVDGNKELHDKCRLFYNGEGSYNLAIAAALQENRTTGASQTKLTYSPENISYVADGVINLLNLGFDVIHGNPVFENVWEDKHAYLYYLELKKIANHIIEKEIEPRIYISMLDPEKMHEYRCEEDLNKNYCGVGEKGMMASIDYTGNIYPCIRFMPSSLGDEVQPFIVGHIDTGIDFEGDNFKSACRLTVKSMSPEECLNCSIASGCGWCSAYCYQTGNLNCRSTYHCLMHVAEAAAAKYLQLKTQGTSSIILPEDKVKKFLPSEDFYLL